MQGRKPSAHPVPLDRDTYDRAVSRFEARVTAEAARQMEEASALGMHAGTKIMELAWPFYSPDAPFPLGLQFDYFPATFAAVNAGMGAFDLWPGLCRLSGQVELVFGDGDYIRSSDYAKATQCGIAHRIVSGGHFPFIEDPRRFSESLARISMP